MKTLVSKIRSLLVFTIIVLVVESCHCGGCEQTMTTEGAELLVNDSASIKSNRSIELSIKSISSIQRSKNNCTDKVLRICTVDELSSDFLTVQCNKDLKLRTETILAGKNLLELASKEPNLNNPYWNGNLSVELPLSDTFATGDYTFILSGKTKDGKPVNDTAVIIW